MQQQQLEAITALEEKFSTLLNSLRADVFLNKDKIFHVETILLVQAIVQIRQMKQMLPYL